MVVSARPFSRQRVCPVPLPRVALLHEHCPPDDVGPVRRAEHRGQRYLLPYDAILLLGYAALLNRWRFFDGLFRRLFVPLILLACLAYLGLGMKLHKFASDNRTMLDWIYSHVREDDDAVIIYNTDSAEFIHGLYGKRNYRMIFSGEEFEAAVKLLK